MRKWLAPLLALSMPALAGDAGQTPETIAFMGQELELRFQSRGESAAGEPLQVWQYLPADASPQRWRTMVAVKVHQDPSVSVKQVVREKVALIEARRANGDPVARHQTFRRGDGEAVIVDMLAAGQTGEELFLEHSVVRVAKPGDHVVDRHMARRLYLEKGDPDRQKAFVRTIKTDRKRFYRALETGEFPGPP